MATPCTYTDFSHYAYNPKPMKQSLYLSDLMDLVHCIAGWCIISIPFLDSVTVVSRLYRPSSCLHLQAMPTDPTTSVRYQSIILFLTLERYVLEFVFFWPKSVQVALLFWRTLLTLRLLRTTFFINHLFLDSVTSSFLSSPYLALKLTSSGTFQKSVLGTELLVSLNAKNIFFFLSFPFD